MKPEDNTAPEANATKPNGAANPPENGNAGHDRFAQNSGADPVKNNTDSEYEKWLERHRTTVSRAFRGC